MIKSIAILIILLFSFPTICFASLPDANIVEGRFDISFGSGVIEDDSYSKERYSWTVVTVDYGLDNNEAIGFGYFEQEYPTEVVHPFINVYEIHYNYQFVEETDENPSFNASFLVGAWFFDFPIPFFPIEGTHLILPEAGVCLSKKLAADWLTGRLNIVFGPVAGLELGIKPHENVEIVAGFAAQWYGIKITF